MATPLIELHDLGLCYRLAKQRAGSFKEFTIRWLQGSLQYEELWALDGIDLSIARGETVGIVGRNGAGKTTLLKVISGVLTPTRGTLKVRGSVSSVLELGVGFDLELTGLENIELVSLLLGRTRREIRERIEWIVDFSGLGEFIRSPLRNYSSGMLSRLGFAIATAWPADLLLIDEVLAVGDSSFTRRCHERLGELRSSGSTEIIVTHDIATVQQQCTACLWLDRGRIRATGEPQGVVRQYLEQSHSGAELEPWS